MDIREKQSNEKRLIDADALISCMDECSKESRFRVYYGYAKSFIDDAPTIDAVPVVRCLDCKHFRHYGKTSLFINGKNIKAGWCQRRISYDEEYRMTMDDFCSYGERKEKSRT